MFLLFCLWMIAWNAAKSKGAGDNSARAQKSCLTNVRQPLWCRKVCKPGSVLTAIYLAPQLLTGSSRLLGTVGRTNCPSTALLRDRVYIVEPMLPWAGCALTAPFHPYSAEIGGAVSLCCTCPEVSLGGRYPLSLPCGARTFLIWALSVPIRGCPTFAAEIFYSKVSELSNPLEKTF